MPCKSIFCIIGMDQCDRDILNAIHLCKELDAHLSVLVVSLAPTPMGGYGVVVSPSWLLDREADIAAMKRREKQVISLVQNAGLKADIDSQCCEKDWAAEIIGQLKKLLGEAARADDPFEFQVVCIDKFGVDGHRELAEAGVTDYIAMPWVFDGLGFDAPLEAKQDSMKRFADTYIHSGWQQ